MYIYTLELWNLILYLRLYCDVYILLLKQVLFYYIKWICILKIVYSNFYIGQACSALVVRIREHKISIKAHQFNNACTNVLKYNFQQFKHGFFDRILGEYSNFFQMDNNIMSSSNLLFIQRVIFDSISLAICHRENVELQYCSALKLEDIIYERFYTTNSFLGQC